MKELKHNKYHHNLIRNEFEPPQIDSIPVENVQFVELSEDNISSFMTLLDRK